MNVDHFFPLKDQIVSFFFFPVQTTNKAQKSAIQLHSRVTNIKTTTNFFLTEMTNLPIQACNSILAYSPNWQQQQILLAIYTYHHGPAQTEKFSFKFPFFISVSWLQNNHFDRRPRLLVVSKLINPLSISRDPSRSTAAHLPQCSDGR